jgi:methylase of polypeptide subunit release factors
VHSEIIKPKGFLVLEIGKGQGNKVAECPTSIEYWEVSSHWDLNWVHRKVKEIFQQCSDLQYQRSGYDLQKVERCLVFQRMNRSPP